MSEYHLRCIRHTLGSSLSHGSSRSVSSSWSILCLCILSATYLSYSFGRAGSYSSSTSTGWRSEVYAAETRAKAFSLALLLSPCGFSAEGNLESEGLESDDLVSDDLVSDGLVSEGFALGLGVVTCVDRGIKGMPPFFLIAVGIILASFGFDVHSEEYEKNAH